MPVTRLDSAGLLPVTGCSYITVGSSAIYCVAYIHLVALTAGSGPLPRLGCYHTLLHLGRCFIYRWLRLDCMRFTPLVGLHGTGWVPILFTFYYHYYFFAGSRTTTTCTDLPPPHYHRLPATYHHACHRTAPAHTPHCALPAPQFALFCCAAFMPLPATTARAAPPDVCWITRLPLLPAVPRFTVWTFTYRFTYPFWTHV